MHGFHLFLAFYHILKELRQFHFHDKKIQWPAVEQVLKEVSPPSDEFIKQVTEQLTISLPAYEAHLHQCHDLEKFQGTNFFLFPLTKFMNYF